MTTKTTIRWNISSTLASPLNKHWKHPARLHFESALINSSWPIHKRSRDDRWASSDLAERSPCSLRVCNNQKSIVFAPESISLCWISEHYLLIWPLTVSPQAWRVMREHLNRVDTTVSYIVWASLNERCPIVSFLPMKLHQCAPRLLEMIELIQRSCLLAIEMIEWASHTRAIIDNGNDLFLLDWCDTLICLEIRSYSSETFSSDAGSTDDYLCRDSQLTSRRSYLCAVVRAPTPPPIFKRVFERARTPDAPVMERVWITDELGKKRPGISFFA